VPLQASQGLTAGIVFPVNFLTEQNYMMRGMSWLLCLAYYFCADVLGMEKWGKDERSLLLHNIIQPNNISPSVAGYVIDDKLDKRT